MFSVLRSRLHHLLARTHQHQHLHTPSQIQMQQIQTIAAIRNPFFSLSDRAFSLSHSAANWGRNRKTIGTDTKIKNYSSNPIRHRIVSSVSVSASPSFSFSFSSSFFRQFSSSAADEKSLEQTSDSQTNEQQQEKNQTSSGSGSRSDNENATVNEPSRIVKPVSKPILTVTGSSGRSGSLVSLLSLHQKFRDHPWFQLVRFDLSMFSAVSSLAGFIIAGGLTTSPVWLLPVASFVGPLALAFSSTIINQIQEMEFDKKMARTRNRPLITSNPEKQISLGKAKLAAGGFAVFGCGALYLATASMLPAGLGLLTMVSYNGIYTPMKRRSIYNTEFGAIVGAIPVFLGASCAWALSANYLFFPEVLSAFAFLVLWQIPHFMVISYRRRRDYYDAGFKMRSNSEFEKPTQRTLPNWLGGAQLPFNAPAYAFLCSVILCFLPIVSYLPGACGEMSLIGGTLASFGHCWRMYKFASDPLRFVVLGKYLFVYAYFGAMFIFFCLDTEFVPWLMQLAHNQTIVDGQQATRETLHKHRCTMPLKERINTFMQPAKEMMEKMMKSKDL